jgi:IS4 transposase
MQVAYDKLIPALKELLSARRLNWLGRTVAFIRRLRQIQASAFVWSVVLSRFGHSHPGFEQARDGYRRMTGKTIWPRPFQMRFKQAEAVQLFESAFDHAVRAWRDGARKTPKHPLAKRFPDIVPIDSTVVQLSNALRGVYKGTRAAAASLKILLAVSVYGLLPLFGAVFPGNRHDMICFPPLDLFRVGTLLLFDKGFACYERLRDIQQARHVYLCPMRLNGNCRIVKIHKAPARVRKALKRHPEGIKLRSFLAEKKRITHTWDLEVTVIATRKGSDRRPIATRLVIIPGPKGKQRPYLTNLSHREWAPAALRELYRLRWQIELVFKELKQHLNLESMPSKDRHAVKIFAWASLIALALSRTVTAWLCPLAQIVGLAAKIRPMLMTRALRATVRLLGRAMVTPPREALRLLRIFADEVLEEVRILKPQREDTFKRLLPILGDVGAR